MFYALVGRAITVVAVVTGVQALLDRRENTRQWNEANRLAYNNSLIAPKTADGEEADPYWFITEGKKKKRSKPENDQKDEQAILAMEDKPEEDGAAPSNQLLLEAAPANESSDEASDEENHEAGRLLVIPSGIKPAVVAGEEDEDWVVVGRDSQESRDLSSAGVWND